MYRHLNIKEVVNETFKFAKVRNKKHKVLVRFDILRMRMAVFYYWMLILK